MNKTGDIKTSKWKGEIIRLSQQDSQVFSFEIDSHGLNQDDPNYPGHDLLIRILQTIFVPKF